MNFYGLSGFVIGFVLGMLVNLYLLRAVPRDRYMADKSLRLRYGLLNWGFAIIGMIIALKLQ